jgi:hypothetical protein
MVSPPPASVKAWVVGDGLGDAPWCRSPNWSNSKTPTGPFHTTVPAFIDDVGEFLRALRADVEDHVVVGRRRRRPSARRLLRHRISCRRPRRPAIGMVAPRLAIFSIRALAVGTRSSSAQRLADLLAAGEQEGVGDAAADHQLVDLFRERFRARSAWSRPWNRRRWRPSGAPVAGSALVSASSSSATQGPAQATGANLAMP